MKLAMLLIALLAFDVSARTPKPKKFVNITSFTFDTPLLGDTAYGLKVSLKANVRDTFVLALHFPGPMAIENVQNGVQHQFDTIAL